MQGGINCVSDLMKITVHTVKPHDTVARARALIEEYRINQLPGYRSEIEWTDATWNRNNKCPQDPVCANQ